MRFLVDENLPFGIVEHLLSLNHDVLDVAASNLRGSSDKVLWAKAAKESRIIITRDLDFPIIGVKPKPFGLILIRIPSNFMASQIINIFKQSLQNIRFEELKNKVAVISSGRIKISPLP